MDLIRAKVVGVGSRGLLNPDAIKVGALAFHFLVGQHALAFIGDRDVFHLTGPLVFYSGLHPLIFILTVSDSDFASRGTVGRHFESDTADDVDILGIRVFPLRYLDVDSLLVVF